MSHTKSETGAAMFVAGLAIGSVLTALLTPRNGEEMRKDIKDKVDSMKDKAHKAGDRVGQKVEKAKDAISRGQNKVEDKVENLQKS